MSPPDDRSPPDPVEEALPSLRSALARAPELLLCLDFDGTLAPIVDDPDAAALTPENRAALETLTAEPTVTTAVVSGRALADVRDRVDGPRLYAGNHGLELDRGDSVTVHSAARECASRIDDCCAVLEAILASVPNARVENKRLTGTVHYRTVPEPARPTVRRLTHRVVDRFGGADLEVSPGKRILEIGPDVDWGKGDAVDRIASATADEAVVVYVGDDVTDESAFRTVEPDGFGVRVGDDEPTAASCRVRSPDDVAELLEWFGTVGVDLLEDGRDADDRGSLDESRSR